MSYRNTSQYPTQGTRFRIGSSDLPGVRTISGLGGGSSTEIDITTLASNAREFTTGLPDNGSVSLEGILPLQHPMVSTLEDAHEASTSLSCAIYIGKVPSGENLTDGSGFETNSDVAVTGAVTGGKLTFTTTADADTFNAISLGDYVKYGSNNAVIEQLVEAGGKLVITTSATVNSTETEIDIIQPGIKLFFNGVILGLNRQGGVEDTWSYDLNMRISGKINRTVGNPDVTVT